jgi:hypothetical protein
MLRHAGAPAPFGGDLSDDVREPRAGRCQAESGLTFSAITSLGASRKTIPGKVVASVLCPANTDPARGGVTNGEPVPAERRQVRPWDAADYARLGMTLRVDVIANEHPENVPSEK